MEFKIPDLKAFSGINGTHVGRKEIGKINEEESLAYYASMHARKAHADFCRQLGNEKLKISEWQD